jgi:hypothetical protein
MKWAFALLIIAVVALLVAFTTLLYGGQPGNGLVWAWLGVLVAFAGLITGIEHIA